MPTNFYAGADAVHTISADQDFGDDYFAVQHMENSRVKLQNLSKAWDIGSQLTCFYPFRLIASRDNPDVTTWVPCMSSVFGHTVSQPKLLRRSFLRSRCVLTPNGEVVGSGDLAYQFSRISYLLLKSKKEAELAECASRDWSMLGQAAYQTARQAIEDRYDRNKMSAEKPLLGKLAPRCTTVVFAVAMDPEKSAPILETQSDSKTKTGMFSQVLSQSRRDKLVSLANNALYGVQAQHHDKTYTIGDVEFLEILYNFTSARMDRGEAGRADPQGIGEALSIFKRFPDCVQKVQDRLEKVPVSSADIRAKLYSMDPVSDTELLKALQSYTFATADSWHYLNEADQEQLLDASSVIDFLRIVPSNADLAKKFEERLGHPIGRAPANSDAAPTIDGLVGDDSKFDTTVQDAAADRVVQEAEQGKMPTPSDEAGDFGESLEV